VRKTGHIFSIFKSIKDKDKDKDKDKALLQIKYIRENKMTLLETLYKHLRYNGLTENAEHFSTEYLNKSRSWYAVQTHQHRDFSASAAIQCLRNINSILSKQELTTIQKKALASAQYRLSKHLAENLKIAVLLE
jgi:hypothetical protein